MIDGHINRSSRWQCFREALPPDNEQQSQTQSEVHLWTPDVQNIYSFYCCKFFGYLSQITSPINPINCLLSLRNTERIWRNSAASGEKKTDVLELAKEESLSEVASTNEVKVVLVMWKMCTTLWKNTSHRN